MGPERKAQVARNAPNVGALRHVEVALPDERRLCRTLADDGKQARLVNGHMTRRKLNLLTLARERIGTLAAHADGTEGGRHLIKLAHKACHRARGDAGVEKLGGHRRRCDDLALGIIGRGLRAKLDARAIALAVEREHAKELGRLPHANHEHAGRVWVERAGMPHATLAERTPRAGDHIMRGHATRLVNREKGVDSRCATSHRCSYASRSMFNDSCRAMGAGLSPGPAARTARMSGSTAASVASIPMSVVKPDAAL